MLFTEKNCLTCGFLFKRPSYKTKSKFCSPKCIRYCGPPEKLATTKNKGFWRNATTEDKFQRISDIYNRNVVRADSCWGWSKKTMTNRYAKIQLGRGTTILAHRASWLIHRGPIPNGLWVLHSCDNPPCTNPEHLFLGSHADNMIDRSDRHRVNAPSGIKHYNVKLSPPEVIEIKSLIKEGYSQSKLAKMFNVTPSAIQSIADGKSWKNI